MRCTDTETETVTETETKSWLKMINDGLKCFPIENLTIRLFFFMWHIRVPLVGGLQSYRLSLSMPWLLSSPLRENIITTIDLLLPR
jgi:hypothetical protein